MTDTAPLRTAGTTSTADARDLKVRAMLLAVVHSLVDDAAKLDLAMVSESEGAAFQVRAPSSDLGKLIGKSGRTARAIRTILSANAAKHGRRYTLDLGQPKG